MAVAEPIDFDLIEEHKENIQSLPSGRSAKALAALCSPPLTGDSLSINDAHNNERAGFEAEISSIDDADDPLDVYDRYIKWTIDTYPSATTNAKSPLLPLLDRARQAFLGSKHYANDPRYLKIWLQHIHLFSDAPREAFVFLARHGIGETLAKFYEEFAAWLEAQNHWSQAEEIYKTGIEKDARPAERLLRRFHDFERRQAAVSDDLKRPESPALPIVRAALASKGDIADADRLQHTAGATAPPKKKSNKMSIFSDAPQASQSSALGSQDPSTWNIESLADRRRENTTEPKPWAGETLKVGKTNNGMGKMAVFKASPPRQSTDTSRHPSQFSKNAKTGKTERVVVWLRSLYAGDSRNPQEHCFEELRSHHRGWARRDWALENARSHKTIEAHTSPVLQTQKTKKKAGFEIFDDQKACQAPLSDPSSHRDSPSIVPDIALQSILPQHENDENALPSARSDVDLAAQRQREVAAAKRLRREERANRTRRIEVVDVPQETQTVQLNLTSPKRPSKVKRKKMPEPTMTITTREAMEEIYGIMSQPQEMQEEQTDGDEESSDSGSDDDDYTSGAESTTTGKLSVANSEYGEETQREILLAQGKTEETPVPPRSDEIDAADAGEGWTDYGVQQPEVDADHQGVRIATAKPQAPSPDIGTTPLFPHHDENITPSEDGFECGYRSPEEDEVGSAWQKGSQGRGRLPFMTPIVEQTESSLGALTGASKGDYFAHKTPSRPTRETINAIEEASDVEEETIELPFEKLSVREQENKRRVLQPLRTKTTRGIVALDAASASRQPLAPVSAATQPRTSGHIIQELQCNPHEPSIRKAILSTRIASMDGYRHHGEQICKKSTELSRYAKSIAKKPAASHDTAMAPKLELPGSDSTYTVCRELGSGAFAPVYLIERQSTISANDDQENECVRRAVRDQYEALKVEATDLDGTSAGITSAWEFYILKLAHERLCGSRAAESIIRAYEMHVFRDESFLVEQYRPQGTLLNLVNRAQELDGVGSSIGSGLDESLAMFFTVELLRTVEALHDRHIIHGDIKGDNVLIRLEHNDDNNPVWDPTYAPDGSQGWAAKGISLIDFGRAIDTAAFDPNANFIADWTVEAHECVEMRECRPWTFQPDYHGLAGTIHMLLFGKYMDPIVDERNSAAAAAMQGSNSNDSYMLGNVPKVYRIRDSLKRYWQTHLWARLFDVLLNPVLHAAGRGEHDGLDADDNNNNSNSNNNNNNSSSSSSSNSGTTPVRRRMVLPVTHSIRAVRKDMQAYLVKKTSERSSGGGAGAGAGLKVLLSRVEAALGPGSVAAAAAGGRRRK